MEASDWDDRYREKELLWSAEANRFVTVELADLEPGSALDLACGEGRNAIWLAQRGWEVTAVDFSAVALGRGRRLASERGADVTWVEGDVTAWDPGRVFDLVLVAYVHLPEPHMTDLMRRAGSWVAPGGRLFAVGHDLSTCGVSGPPVPEVLWSPGSVPEWVAPLELDWVERRSRPTDSGAKAMDTVFMARRVA